MELASRVVVRHAPRPTKCLAALPPDQFVGWLLALAARVLAFRMAMAARLVVAVCARSCTSETNKELNLSMRRSRDTCGLDSLGLRQRKPVQPSQLKAIFASKASHCRRRKPQVCLRRDNASIWLLIHRSHGPRSRAHTPACQSPTARLIRGPSSVRRWSSSRRQRVRWWRLGVSGWLRRLRSRNDRRARSTLRSHIHVLQHRPLPHRAATRLQRVSQDCESEGTNKLSSQQHIPLVEAEQGRTRGDTTKIRLRPKPCRFRRCKMLPAYVKETYLLSRDTKLAS